MKTLKLLKESLKNKFFGRSVKVEESYSTFIDSLEEEHQQLLYLHDRIIKYSEKDKIRAAHLLLTRFKSIFFSHVMRENGVLYSRIRKAYSDNKEVSANVNTFKSEMSNIQRYLTSFLKKWDLENIEQNTTLFLKEFSEAGEKLKIRIQKEEEILYLLYKEIDFKNERHQ